MLRRRLGEFLVDLPRHHHRAFIRLVLLYALGRRTSRDLQVAGREWGCTDALFEFKADFLDRSHYMLSVFWRACFMYFRSIPCSPGGPDVTSVDFGTLSSVVSSLPVDGVVARRCCNDVALVEAFLDLREHQALRRIGTAAYFTNPTDQDLRPLVQELYRYCGGLANRKMRFLVNNDPGHTLDDFIVELFEAGLSTLRHYDADSDQPLKLLNFARRGAKNHCLRLIDYHTAQRRARLVRVSNDPMGYRVKACGTCAWLDCKVDGESCRDTGVTASAPACPRERVYHRRNITTEKVCGNCRYYDTPHPGATTSCLSLDRDPREEICPEYHGRGEEQEFIRTTGSIHRQLGDDQRSRQLEDVIGRPDPRDREWIEGLLREVDGEVARVVRITLGIPDEDFEQWLWQHADRGSVGMTDRQVARYACEFCDVALKDVKRVLRATASLGKVA